MPDPLERLRELSKKLPSGLRSDWVDTNHYELTSPTTGDHWWLAIGDYFRNFDGIPCETEEGQRIGLLLDLAEEISKLRDEGIL